MALEHDGVQECHNELAEIVLPPVAVEFLKEVSSLENTYFVLGGINSVYDLIATIIAHVETSPGVPRCCELLPPEWRDQPEIAALILLIIYLYGYPRYNIKPVDNGWIIYEPGRMLHHNLAKKIMHLCRLPNLNKLLGVTRANKTYTITGELNAVTYKINLEVVYNAKTLQRALEKRGMRNDYIHGKHVTIQHINGVVTRIVVRQ